MVMTASDPISQERAVQLAIIILTRRDDLRVVRSQDECQPDLIVTLLEDGLPTGKYLGIEAKAVSNNSGRMIEQTLQRNNFDAFREAPFPICLFVFAMDTDKGYWKWLRMPDESAADLTLVQKEVKPLNNLALESLIDTVTWWYSRRAK